METRLPDHSKGLRGYSSLFVVGWRAAPTTGLVEQTGTIIVKRTYTIDRRRGALTPADSPEPVFLTDEPVGAEAPEKPPLRFEHDLASFKPEADVVVLGFPGPAGAMARVLVGGQEWLARTLGAGERHLFGWASRTESPRLGYAGTFAGKPALPADFDNRFFSGYRRDARATPAPPSLPPRARIVIEREGAAGYSFDLRDDVGEAAYCCYTGSGPDREALWRRHGLPMTLDTLVVEPERDRCYLVWRGVWPFAGHAAETYRLLLVQAAA